MVTKEKLLSYKILAQVYISKLGSGLGPSNKKDWFMKYKKMALLAGRAIRMDKVVVKLKFNEI